MASSYEYIPTFYKIELVVLQKECYFYASDLIGKVTRRREDVNKVLSTGLLVIDG